MNHEIEISTQNKEHAAACEVFCRELIKIIPVTNLLLTDIEFMNRDSLTVAMKLWFKDSDDKRYSTMGFVAIHALLHDTLNTARGAGAKIAQTMLSGKIVKMN